MAFPPAPWTPLPAPPMRGTKFWDTPLDTVLADLADTAELAWQNDIDIAAALLLRGVTPVSSISQISGPADGQLVYNTTTRIFERYDSAQAEWIPFGNVSSFASSYRGVWTAGSYAGGDIVVYRGSTWIATVAVTASQAPGVDPAWGVVAAAGVSGGDGPAGATGPAGSAGATGAAGATGPAGSAGAAGATGPAGTAGAAGATGPTGPTGSAGATGAVGATGPAGTAGAAGATGAAGSTGATGPAGPGVPAGGAVGTWLKKNSTTDFDTVFAGITEGDVAGLTTDLAAKVASSSLGVASGVATLDSGAKLPSAQLPSGLITSFGTPGSSAVGDAVAAGSSTSAAHADHLHGRESFGAVTAQTTFGVASVNGTATTPARSDHTHGTPSLIDGRAARIGLVAEPFPLEAVNAMLGASSDFLILALVRPGVATIANLGVWMGSAGVTPSGVNAMALFDESGNQLGVTGDMSTALSTAGNANTHVEVALVTPYTTANATNYYLGILCHMGTAPTIGLAYQSGAIPAFPTIKGHRPSILVSGQTTMPSSFSVSGATAANAAYWLVAS